MRRIRRSKKTPLLVFTSDREFVEGNLGEMENVEFEIIGNSRRLVLDEIGPTDLVIAPATVLRDASVATKWRMAQALTGMNLVAIAGPRRMSISKGVTRRGIQSVVQAGM